MSEERMVELETKLAYQEDLLETLNSIVAAQQQQLDQMEKVCRALIERWEYMNDALKAQVAEEYEIPPHY
ncbi:MAG TPA: SlyX family protein [Alcanivoracaceae bacterium]|nr:SlyX family protein [Alcanivoracaceae bacterium]